MRSEQFCLFRLCIAGDVLLRSEKEGRLSERSELCVPPDCSDTAPGTPKGRCIAVAFLCLLSLATVCVKLVVAFSIRDRITESDLALCSNTHGLAIANCACPQTIVEDTYV